MTKHQARQLSIGYIPLSDCLPLIAAQENGYFSAQGLDVTLSRESSWASVRDKLLIGQLDAAQFLAPMLAASTLGLGGIRKQLVSAFVMNLNGNAITVSDVLFQQMQHKRSAAALSGIVKERRQKQLEPLVFAVVFAYASHNYLLRDWLISGGIDPDRDIKLVVLPPTQMVDNLQQQHIDGFCVGEPWNTVAIMQGIGHCVTTTAELWGRQIEKVLAVTAQWQQENQHRHEKLLKALDQSCRWIDENPAESIRLLQEHVQLPLEKAWLETALSGNWYDSKQAQARVIDDFLVFSRHRANCPNRMRVDFLLSQMLDHGALSDMQCEAARACYQETLYQQILGHKPAS